MYRKYFYEYTINHNGYVSAFQDPNQFSMFREDSVKYVMVF